MFISECCSHMIYGSTTPINQHGTINSRGLRNGDVRKSIQS